MKEVDLIVIGSGPAGQRAAIQAVKLGKSAVVVEKRKSIGGVCINTGMLKLIFHQQTGLLLGVHIIGEGACELIHIGQAVLTFGSISYFADTVFNYPTLAEAYKVAALNGLKRVGTQNIAAEEFDAPQGQQASAIAPVATE